MPSRHVVKAFPLQAVHMAREMAVRFDCRDVLDGTYYPCASIYTLPEQTEGATVSFNFGVLTIGASYANVKQRWAVAGLQPWS